MTGSRRPLPCPAGPRPGRLLLRPLTGDDAGALLAYRSLPEVCRWVPFEPMDADTIAARLDGPWATSALTRDGDAMTLGVELVGSGTLIGDVLLRRVAGHDRTGELGYVFHPHHGGRGYAGEAAHVLLHTAFDELGLHRVIARVVSGNAASTRVATRLGMRQEAPSRTEWFKGRWTTVHTYAVLARDWADQHTP